MDKFKAALDYSLSQAKQFPLIREIWLYGSYARGENSPQSDVDLFVVTESSIDGKSKIKIKNALCSDDYHLPEVDVHFGVYKNDEKIDSAGTSLFLKNIKKDGKLIYSAN